MAAAVQEVAAAAVVVLVQVVLEVEAVSAAVLEDLAAEQEVAVTVVLEDWVVVHHAICGLMRLTTMVVMEDLTTKATSVHF